MTVSRQSFNLPNLYSAMLQSFAILLLSEMANQPTFCFGLFCILFLPSTASFSGGNFSVVSSAFLSVGRKKIFSKFIRL